MPLATRMVRKMPHALLPECDHTLLDQYEVDDRLECLQWLSRLNAGGVELALHVSDHGIDCISGQISEIDESAGTLDVALDADWLSRSASDAFRHCSITAVAVLDAVKIQFDAAGLGLQARDHTASSQPLLRLKWPDRLYRLQRRNAYRITPPPFAPASLWLATPDEPAQERLVDVADISATGIAFRWPALAGPAPAQGKTLSHCRLELAGTIPIRCDLVVTDIRTDDPAADRPDARTRVGCRFSAIDPASARGVQMYVDAAQRRLRTRKPLTAATIPPGQATDPAQALAARQTRNSAPRSDGHRSAQST